MQQQARGPVIQKGKMAVGLTTIFPCGRPCQPRGWRQSGIACARVRAPLGAVARCKVRRAGIVKPLKNKGNGRAAKFLAARPLHSNLLMHCWARRGFNPSRKVFGANLQPLPHLDACASQYDGSAYRMDAVVHDLVPGCHGPAKAPRRAGYFPAWSASVAARLRCAASSLPLGSNPFCTIFVLYHEIQPFDVEAVGCPSFTLAIICS